MDEHGNIAQASLALVSRASNILLRIILQRIRVKTETAWISTWTGLSVKESIRITEDRDKWKKYVHGVANPRIEDG